MRFSARKRTTAALAIFLGCASVAWATEPSTLTTLRAIHALTNEQAAKSIPVAFEATLTFIRSSEKSIFVQDGDIGIYVQAATNDRLIPGDRIFITGTTHGSFRPIVQSNDIRLVRHGPRPEPIPASYGQLIRGEVDCRLVSVRGRILSADLELSNGSPTVSMQLLTEGGLIDAVVDSGDTQRFQQLLDSEVDVIGADSGRFDGKMEMTGTLIHVTSADDVNVIKAASTDPSSLPVTPMDQILNGYHEQVLSQRIRVHGTVTYYQPGSAIVLQNGSKSLWIQTHSLNPLHIGDVADVTGFPGLRDGFLTLTSGAAVDHHVAAPVAPQPATWHQLVLSGNVFDLVSIEGQVVTEVREAAQDEYVLAADGHQFSAIYRHPPTTRLIPQPLSPMKQIPIGARIRVTGICALEDSNPFDAQVPFMIFMRTSDDITVIAKPPWLTVPHLIYLIGLLLTVIFIVASRGWFVEHLVRGQNASLAYIERRRSRVLEDINGTRPLAEIVEQITELVSFKLNGAPCWCQINDGALLGNCPTQLDAFRIVEAPIPGRSGLPLGTFSAAFDPRTEPQAREKEGLALATGLAALAIETRRLYSDLRRRSEFDLLTDTHNRFSLEKHLDNQIIEARQKASVFGLIYIDLDEFKQINDVYGHAVGDHFLQEVAIRMKRQLRSHDLLARLGGDEFAILVPMVRSRYEIDEIVHRLERSLDEPFPIEGYKIKGSASFGAALYPEDGPTKDILFKTADVAMYNRKQSAGRKGRVAAGVTAVREF